MKTQYINGYVGGAGKSCTAARVDHTHATNMKVAPVEIKTTDWSDKAATVAYPADMAEGGYVGYMVAAGSAAAATSAVLVLTTAGDDGLTFGVTNTPAAALDLFILYV